MLKSLELFGFKSFADRTRFDFPPGIACVVGPNGSGKSNVVDALKWILGDQSPKSLRGREMSDVIFNGSAGRKPSAFAEATLTFDNTQRFLAHDMDEVTVGRRLWTNGDSEYLINGNVSRLKDVRDTFMGTGAGSSAYSIIEQGKVGQILQANAAARRIVFEEAAGISRFKSRKTDALRKIERVSQNLVRLTDIVDQLESQLNSTRTQAAKATKYREAARELKRSWLGLAADDFRHQSAILSRITTELSDLTGQLDETNEQQHEIEHRLGSFDSEIAEVEDQLREADRAGSSTRESIVSRESTIAHESQRLEETEAEIERLRHEQGTLAARLRDTLLALASAQEELDQFETTCTGQQKALADVEREITAVSDSIRQTRAALASRRESMTRLADRTANAQQQSALLTAQLESIDESSEALLEQRDVASQEIEAAQVELDQRRTAMNDVLNRVSELNESFKRLKSRQKKLAREQSSGQKQLSKLREERSAAQARVAVLEDLEERQAGLGMGVREILNRARRSKQTPWKHVLGSVADLLDVDLENAALMEVALASRSQLIVMDDVRPLIERISDGRIRIDGRVGFVGLNGPVVNAELESEPDIDLSADAEVICRADTLLSERSDYRELAQRLLAGTWVVMSIEAAERLQAEHAGLRFVTLQGELLESDGTIFAGTIRGEASILSRKSELRRLQGDLERLDREVNGKEQHIETQSGEMTELEEELKAAKERRDQINGELDGLKEKADEQQKSLDRLVLQRETIDEQLESNEQKKQSTREQHDTAVEELARLETEQQRAEAGLGELEKQLKELEQQQQQLQEKQTEEKLTLTRHEERRERLQETCERTSDEAERHCEQLEQTREQVGATIRRRRTSLLKVLNARASLAELAIEIEHFDREVALQDTSRNRLREVRGNLVEEDTAVRQSRRALEEQQHELETQIREIRHQLRTAGQRIEEEYGISIQEAVAAGASAFRDLLVERGVLEDALESADIDRLGDDSVAHGEDFDEDVAAEIDAEEELDEEIDDDLTDDDDDDSEEDFEDEEEDGNWSDDDEEEWSEDDDTDEDEDGFEEDADDEEPVDEEDLEADVDDLNDEITAPAHDPAAGITLQPVEGIAFEEVRDELEEQVNRLRRRMKTMGSVNTDSLDDLDELETRYDHFHSQLMDLTEAKTTLEDIIRQINTESRRLFLESFEAIQREFRELFRKLFGGGEGDIILEDPDDVLDCGIDIVARPPGKELRSITLLSGGEKTMTAVALLLAIFRSRPSPFCILDEVDAALDEANVERYAAVIREFRDTTQFIMISHRKRTMVVADVIYGVTMEQSGVSKRMSVRFEDVGEDGELKSGGGTGASSDAQAA